MSLLEFWAKAADDSEREMAIANSRVNGFFIVGTLLAYSFV